MTRFALLALPLLLAACGGGSAPRPAAEPESADLIACRAEARNDPRYAALGATALPGNRANETRIAQERARLEADLISACLRARGAAGGTARGGGVEAVRR
ncbi:MAG: phosphoribosylamine--glycine ligase [Acetobacteraceae bacterium]